MLTPPGKPTHKFTHTPVNLTADYVPPEVNMPDTTKYLYNLDRQLTKTILPDSSFIEVAYDTSGCGCGGAGKPKTITFYRGTTTFDYDSLTGQLEKITSPENNTLSYNYDGSLPSSGTWNWALSWPSFPKALSSLPRPAGCKPSL